MRVALPPGRDAALPAALALALVVEVAVSTRANGPFLADAPLYAAAALALAWRRRVPGVSPVIALALALVATVAGTDITELTTSLLFLVLPAYAVGHECAGRGAWLAFAACVALMIAVTGVAEGVSLSTIAFPAGIQAAAFACGQLLRTRMLMTRALADEAARLELDRELRAQAAVGEERARIAREMHDVVAHTMAIMVVQAGAARSVLDRDPSAAVQALGTVEETGRVALGELRRLLGFLREDGRAELAPQPSLEGLDALVARARDAGLPVDLSVEGTARSLDPGASLAAYRVIQEALTNTLKHAGPGARASLVLRWKVESLVLSVVDTGGVGTALGGGGHGLVGMRERVTLLGGELIAQPRPDGGFVVHATIPCCKTEVTA